MARRKRGWFERLILGRYAKVLDRAEELIEQHETIGRVDLENSIRLHEEHEHEEHEKIIREVDQLRAQLDATTAEVRSHARTLSI